jgi:Hfq protein
MSAGPPHALQDTLLEHLRKHKVPVTVFLANGVRPQGTDRVRQLLVSARAGAAVATGLQARHLDLPTLSWRRRATTSAFS